MIFKLPTRSTASWALVCTSLTAAMMGLILAGCGGGGGGSSGINRSRLIGTWETSRISTNGQSVSCSEVGEIVLGDSGDNEEEQVTVSCSYGELVRFEDDGTLLIASEGDDFSRVGEWELNGSDLTLTVLGEVTDVRVSLSGDTLRIVASEETTGEEYTSELTRL